MKVLFVHKYEEGDYEVEKLWCNRIGETNEYIVDNIPFVVRRVALGDIVTIEYDEEEKEYYFSSFVQVSGNSTVRLYFENLKGVEDVRRKLESFGCESEWFLSRKILAVNVPQLVDYKPIKRYLDEGESKNLWHYEEPCLAHDY